MLRDNKHPTTLLGFMRRSYALLVMAIVLMVITFIIRFKDISWALSFINPYYTYVVDASNNIRHVSLSKNSTLIVFKINKSEDAEEAFNFIFFSSFLRNMLNKCGSKDNVSFIITIDSRIYEPKHINRYQALIEDIQKTIDIKFYIDQRGQFINQYGLNNYGSAKIFFISLDSKGDIKVGRENNIWGIITTGIQNADSNNGFMFKLLEDGKRGV